MIPYLSVAGDHGVLRRNGVLKNPTRAILAQIFLGLDKAAQITRMDGFSHIPQSLNAVQPRVFRVGNSRDAVFLLYRSSPLSFLDLVWRVADNSVSTYSLMMDRAFS